MKIAEYKPNIGLVYRDATEEEIAKSEKDKPNFEEPITIEDLLDAINILSDIVLGEE